METENTDNLHQDEKTAFDNIKSDIHADSIVEKSIVEALKSKELIKSNNNMKTNHYYWMAAAVAGFAIGFFLNFGMVEQTNTPIDNRTKYALFLYENEAFTVDDGSTLIKEYTKWATDLATSGHLTEAEKLADQSNWLGQTSTTNQNSKLTGYFIYYANDFKEALAIAQTHPHSSYGGGIEVRAIEKLN